MIIGGILVYVCFWTGVYEITKKVVVPTIKAVVESIQEVKKEESEQE